MEFGGDSNCPICCFVSFDWRDEFFKRIDFSESNTFDRQQMDPLVWVDRYESQQQNHVYSAVVRVPTRNEFLRCLVFLHTKFSQILLFHSSLTMNAIMGAVGPEAAGLKFVLNPTMREVETGLAVRMTDQNRRIYTQMMNRPFNADGRQLRAPNPLVFESEFHQTAMREYEQFVMQHPVGPRHAPPIAPVGQGHGQPRQPPPVQRRLVFATEEENYFRGMDLDYIFAGESDQMNEDAYTRRATEISLREEARMQERLAEAKIKLQEGWKNVLKKSEPIKEGRPVCIVCLESCATICFVDCNHQVQCDECVEIMWTRADLAHKCPLCMADVNLICRPICSEVHTVAAPLEHEHEQKRQKKTKLSGSKK